MENTIGREFIEKTKYENLEPSAQSQGVPWPELSLPLEAGAQVIDLPAGDAYKPGNADLVDLIAQRQSLRKYSVESINLAEFAYLLWGTQGVKSLLPTKPVTMRTVPSAGARHAFETWLLVNRVDGLEPGLYRYLALEHKLAHLPAAADINAVVTEACLKQSHVKTSAVTFMWSAVQERMTWRYCQRGYRYLYLDAGHVCQNLYLLAESIGCGVCAIAAFDDDLANQALALDGVDQFVIYIASLGKRQKEA